MIPTPHPLFYTPLVSFHSSLLCHLSGWTCFASSFWPQRQTSRGTAGRRQAASQLLFTKPRSSASSQLTVCMHIHSQRAVCAHTGTQTCLYFCTCTSVWVQWQTSRLREYFSRFLNMTSAFIMYSEVWNPLQGVVFRPLDLQALIHGPNSSLTQTTDLCSTIGYKVGKMMVFHQVCILIYWQNALLSPHFWRCI